MGHVENAWSGATTPDGFTVKAKVVNVTTVRLAVSQTPDLASPVYFGPLALDPDTISAYPPRAMFGLPVGPVVTAVATGLDPATWYYYALEVDGVIDTGRVGRARTAPAVGEPSSFKFAVSTCAGQGPRASLPGPDGEMTDCWPTPESDSRISNHVGFSHIAATRPDFFIHTGDLHYRDINVDDTSAFRNAYDEVLNAPRQQNLYLLAPVAYMWDDHDYGPNNSDRTAPGRAAAAYAYRQRVPHHPLPDSGGVGIWQSWTYGRVRFVMPDVRSYRDPDSDTEGPSKTLLGPEQKAWLKAELLAARDDEDIRVVCLVWSDPWIQSTTHLDERAELGDFITANGLDRMMFAVCGDWHGIGFDDGTNNPYGGFPVYQAGPIDSRPSGPSVPYSHGSSARRGQFATVSVRDTGRTVQVAVQGHVYDAAPWWLRHSFTLGARPVLVATSLGGTVAGRAFTRGREVRVEAIHAAT